jgi:hypothetical protein
MTLETDIKREFLLTKENVISDEFIVSNPDAVWLNNDIDYMTYVPSYMLWCLKNGDSDGNLVTDFTITALAEFGRAKSLENKLNFKFLCNYDQRRIVLSFLQHCLLNLKYSSTEEQIKRAIKNWERSV